MKTLIFQVICNVIAFGLFSVPAYLWRGVDGLNEVGISTASIALIFILTYLALGRSFKNLGDYGTTIMLGKMGMHMLGTTGVFILLPTLLGFDLKYLMPWLILAFFVNLGIELVSILRLTGGALKKGAESV